MAAQKSYTLRKIQGYGFSKNENMLICGDNLVALHALKPAYKQKVQCIYIDPPYNTCQPFDGFYDNLSQRQWEQMMKKTLLALWPFLTDTGSIWISIDDYEYAYLKVLCDKLWGTDAFIATIVRQKNKYSSSVERSIVHMHDYILVYAKNNKKVKFKPFLPEKDKEIFYDEKLKYYWSPENLLVRIDSLAPFSRLDNHIYEIETPLSQKIVPPKGRCWRINKREYLELLNKGQIWFDGEDPFPFVKKIVKKKEYVLPSSIWDKSLAGSNQDARKEIAKYNTKKFFYVPKPEKLIATILSICTDPNDLVLDAFLGSGTTAVVAHKMGRRWIGIEKEHAQCDELCLPRLINTIEGKKESKLDRFLEWQGGNGFSYYKVVNVSEH